MIKRISLVVFCRIDDDQRLDQPRAERFFDFFQGADLYTCFDVVCGDFAVFLFRKKQIVSVVKNIFDFLMNRIDYFACPVVVYVYFAGMFCN